MIKRAAPWLAWAAVALLAMRFVWFTLSTARQPSDGFAAYYTAARLLREGRSVSRFYDNAWFRLQVARFNPAEDDIYNVNPPTTVLLALPLAGLGRDLARLTWLVLSLMVLPVSLGFLVWQLRLPGVAAPAFFGLALLYQPLFANVLHAQVYIFLLGLMVLAWYGHRRDGPGLMGTALGLMLVLKTAGAMLWLLPAAGRRWRTLIVGLGVVLVVVLATLPWIGLAAWSTYLPLLAGLTARPETSVTAYQTVLSFFRHIFVYDAQWNPAPLWNAPALGLVLPVVGLVAMLAASAYAVVIAAEPDLTFALFAIASVVLSPVSLDYHYTLLLVPVAVLLAWVYRHGQLWHWAVLAAGVALIAANLPYNSPRVSYSLLALLAYPKLYGACLLWALAWWAAVRGVPSRRLRQPATATVAAAHL
jgi:hypothetical protein